MTTNRKKDAQILHDQALALAKQGHHAEAIETYRRVLKLNPKSQDTLNNLGAALQESGQTDQAIAIYHQALAINPNNAGLHINLANALRITGKLDESIGSLHQAIKLDPKIPQAHNALGNTLKAKGSLNEATKSYEQALALRSNYPQALNNLAATLLEDNKPAEALAIARKTVALHPQYSEAHNTLGTILKADGKFDEAISSYQHAIALNSNYADAHNNLGVVLFAKGLLDQAVESYRRALAIKPDFPQALNNLGFVLKEQGLSAEAKAAFTHSLSFNPNFVSAYLNLGLLYRENANLDQSIIWYQKALAVDPTNPIAHNGLGNTEKDRGNVDNALACFRQALALSPLASSFNSNYLYTLHFSPNYDTKAILDAHRQWDQRIAQPLRNQLPPPSLDPTANRRLRIGYVSSDMRGHVVGRHLLPLISNHDRTQFEIFCYTGVRKPDAFTDQLRSHTDHWRQIIGMSDADLAKLIRADRIDILVDLTLHMAGTRLLAFARKPAPIQLTWLGYCSTTGLSTMDYRLSDTHLDPPGNDDLYVEKTIYLQRTYWCYQIKGTAPDLSPLPAQTSGQITFGCLNNFAKVSTLAQELWARLLKNLPKSRLIIHCGNGSHRESLLNRFTQNGVSADRIQFFTGGSWDLYMREYHKIDIALDPFPYGGGITTCDALYMGVPVITLTAQTAVGRGGTSILSNLNLQELIAKTPEDYIQIAASLAEDLESLSALRSSLRTHIQNSPLMDAPAFARDFEAIYRDLTIRTASK